MQRPEAVHLRRMCWWDIVSVMDLERELFAEDAWTPEMFWSELSQADSRYYLVAVEQVGPTDNSVAGLDAAGSEPAAAAAVPAQVHRAHDASGGSERLVGYAGLLVGRDDADVQTIAVRESHWGTGLGAALLDALLREAAGRGCDAVLLEVRVDNERAQALYRRFGFEPVGVRRGYYQPSGTDGLVMRLVGVQGKVAAGEVAT